jgi:hypothetical protein
MAQANVPATDPAVYDAYKEKWSTLPDSADAWLARAREVAEVLAQDAAQRDQDNKSPRAEVVLLKYSGLLKLLGPKKYGGGEQPWHVAYKAIREVAKGDGSIGMLLGYHLLWSTTANVVGTAEQADRLQELIITKNLFVGGAVNPRDNDLKITAEGDSIVFNGFKQFNTGGVVSDLTVLEGVLDGTQDHIFAIVETDQPGIQFAHNWKNIGLRLTESGSVKIENVRASWTDALGWDATSRRPLAEVLTIPFASLFLPTYVLHDFFHTVLLTILVFSWCSATSISASPSAPSNSQPSIPPRPLAPGPTVGITKRQPLMSFTSSNDTATSLPTCALQKHWPTEPAINFQRCTSVIQAIGPR